jgi:methylmalonyl-CoA mutase N-terminal domain/subunit
MRVQYSRETWERELAAAPERGDGVETSTLSGMEVAPLYTSDDLPGSTEELPGQYPYTRGIHASGYRSRLWTMRQFAGFATAEQTNRRYKTMLANGQTGLSVAFDMPTLMGQDSDAPTSRGEIGHCGVAIDSLADMEALLDGIPLGQVSTSMTINSPAAILLCMYLAVAEKQGVPFAKVNGTLQNDILKEFIAQKEFIFPPAPSMRLVVDSIEYCTREVPRWNTVSISGYHIREAGSTAAQELAFTLADGFAYVDACIERGLHVDEFAPRLSFFFDAHIDFFEEIAKFRAARRIWARHMRERYGARDERSWKLRFHTQTAGVSLTAQQPELNIARTAVEALAGVLGGTQSLHTNAMDEVLALPTDRAARIALRTQQVLAYETGVASTVDPLGGSYFVESLTDRMEAEAEAYFERIESYGGVVPAIEAGFMQKEIADAAFRHQQELEHRRRIMVGVNGFVSDDDGDLEILRIPASLEREQSERVQEVRRRRDAARASRALGQVRGAAASPTENLMPHILDAVRAYCTEGEIMDAMVAQFGRYTEKAII